MSYIYGGIFVMAILLLPLYFAYIHKKQKELWLFVLFLCVSIVNLGYLLISVSETVEFALFANKIAYLGQVVIPMCMFLLISKLCDFSYKKEIVGILIGLAVFMFGIVCTTGYLDWYYASATLASEGGASYLVKEYGVLHPCNLIYVLSYFIAMLSVIGISLKKNNGRSHKLATFMLTIILGNIGMWIIEKLITTSFEILSISYLMSVFAFYFVYLILQDYIHIKDIPPPVIIEEKAPIIVLDSIPRAEKIKRIIDSLPEGTMLSVRQMDMLEGIVDGKSRKEIAADLHLSENTIKMHISSLYRLLNVSSREEIYALFKN